MKTFILGAALALAAATAANAQADPNWTGPYIGLQAGASLNGSPVTTSGTLTGNINNVTNNARPRSVSFDHNGGLIGGQLGYNYQYGNFVGGLETDIASLDVNDTQTYASPAAFGAAAAGTRSYFSSKLNYLGTVRARLGYLISPRVLLYGTGGYAYGGVKYRADFANSAGASQFSGSDRYDASGYAAGAGVEYAYPTNFNILGRSSAITLRAEWLHYDLGTKEINVAAVPNVGAGAYVSKFKTAGDELRTAVNFKF